MSALADLATGWEQAAQDDAMFNILTQPGYENGGWDSEKFFAHGTEEVERVLVRLRDLGLRHGSERALDFGCGVGRLTQALAEHFERVDGVDISPEMVRLAREHNRHGKRVAYRVNRAKSLKFPDGSFDFIYSVITLQHMPRELQRGYVTEFLRLLRDGGLAVFQVPEGGEYHHPDRWLSMYGTDRKTIAEWVEGAGGKVLDVEVSEHSGPEWLGYRYTVA